MTSAYRLLPSLRSIRLLKLIPSGSHFATPSLSLECFELDKAPRYCALSYTWGVAFREGIEHEDEDASQGSEQSVEIEIGGDTYQITSNLQAALSQLWVSGYGTLWLWVDAICINQGDSIEKASQVSLMGEIYSKAGFVIVWLGPHTTDLVEFDWMHREFLDALMAYIEESGMDNLGHQNPLDHQFLARLNVTPPGGAWIDCWESYFRFCRQRRWFSRTWIVQEVALARGIIIECGPLSIDWARIERLAAVINLLGWQPLVGPNASRAFGRAMGDETVRLWMIRLKAQTVARKLLETITTAHDPEEVSKVPINREHLDQDLRLWYEFLQRLLFDTRPYSASDPRDKIFANLAIAQQALLPGITMQIKPDYSPTSTPESIYEMMASLFLTKLSRLSNLSHVEDKASSKILGLPSWVPDYSCTLTPTPFICLRNDDCAFDCCPIQCSQSVLPTISNHILDVKGAVFDRVVEVCLPMWEVIQTHDVRPCLDICENLRVMYEPTRQNRVEVLWRTLIADTYADKPAESTMAASFKDWVRAQLAIKLTQDAMQTDGTGQSFLNEATNDDIISQLSSLTKLHNSDSGNPALPTITDVTCAYRLANRFQLQNLVGRHATLDPNDPFPTVEEQQTRLKGNSGPFQMALNPTLPFRRLYRTAKGYLGIGPASMNVGDEIWLLQDAMVPFILRERERIRSFMLVGEAYLHGYMDGKMLEELDGKLRSILIS